MKENLRYDKNVLALHHPCCISYLALQQKSATQHTNCNSSPRIFNVCFNQRFPAAAVQF